MKRFAASVMTVVMSLCLSGLAMDAHASPGDAFRGDPVGPSENGTGPGSGGDGTAGGDGTGPGGSGGTGDPGVTVPGLSTPRVMLSGFTSAPAEVEAGQDFTVSFTLKNTSTRTRVQNIKVSLSSGEGAAFLPANGSSSMFIDRISAGDDSIQTMAFHSLPSLEEKPYQLTLLVEYEDAVANSYQSQEMVSVQVKQGIRADTSAPQVMPEAIQVGQDASVTFNIHNQGKTKLYNAKAVIKAGQGITGEDLFIGTIEPGTSGAVDMLVRGEEELTEPLVIEVTYEDVDGKVTALSKEVPLMVMPMDMSGGEPTEEPMVEEGMGIPLIPLIIGLLLLILLVVVLLVVRRSRRRSRERDDMDSLSMIGDDPLVPTDNLRG
ncbi:COG1361 S-layer family protein [Tessaracoccus sp.]